MEIDVQQYDQIAKHVFAPVYPLIAAQIIAHTGVTQGTCLDIGCGGGYLGAALAQATDLLIHFFDPSAEMLAITDRTIVENGLAARAKILQGDVAQIPLPDDAVNLAVSRGSIFFWEDLPRALAEIYRVLAPGGWAYIGGGFGSSRLKRSIEQEMAIRNQGSDRFSSKIRRNLGTETRARFVTALKTAGIDANTILHSEKIGLWLVMKKEK